MNTATLYIFSGLPASGKSTLAQLLSRRVGAMYLRIDTVEQGIRDLFDFKVEGEGYRLSYRILKDNLNLGLSVIADSCNPIKLTRDEWQEVAISAGAHFINIEIKCSDPVEHECRANIRDCQVTDLILPTWEQIKNRRYEQWERDVIQIDTAGKSVEQSFHELMNKLSV